MFSFIIEASVLESSGMQTACPEHNVQIKNPILTDGLNKSDNY